MTRIGVVIHGPAVIDSGRAERVLEILARAGSVNAILGGAMGRAAVIDAGLEQLIDISRNLKPSESIRNLCSCSDLVLLVNEGKTRETGIEFGRLVNENLGASQIPLFQIEYGGSNAWECLCIPWVPCPHACAIKLQQMLQARPGWPPPARKNVEIEGEIIRKRIAGIRPGEYVTVNGTVIGKALAHDVWLISEGGRITAIKGGRLKPHGVGKVEHVDLLAATIRSGPLRTADVTPRMLEHERSGHAVIIDHSAEDTFELAKYADLAVVVGDDTTAIAGDLLTRLGIPMIGIIDGDRDGILHHANKPPGSVIIKVAPGNDDLVGNRVRKEIFGGGIRTALADEGIEGILARVLDVSQGLVEEITRY